MMKKLRISIPGSFQYPRLFQCDNPVEEVWSRIARFGSYEYVKNNSHQDKKDIDWEEYIRYSIIRIRQAVEFRSSVKNTSLLTSPVPVYYSFLNLTRAFLAIGPEIMPNRGHGLTFHKEDEVIKSYATMKKGTFTDYLESYGITWSNDTKITLEDAFARIIEVYYDFDTMSHQKSLVTPIKVEAYVDGDVFFKFLDNTENFNDNWVNDYPRLKDICELTSEKSKLKVINREDYKDNDDKLIKFINDALETDLIWHEFSNRWFLIRETQPEKVYPRSAYYFIALFILSSIVRYEPELMHDLINPEKELSWFLSRFMNAAERFYPQLKLIEIHDSPIYF